MFRQFYETVTWEKLCWETEYGIPVDVREAARVALSWGKDQDHRELLEAYILSEMNQQDLKQAVKFLIGLLKDNGIDNFVYPFNYGYIGVHPYTLFHEIADKDYATSEEQQKKTDKFLKLCQIELEKSYRKPRKFKGNIFKQNFNGQKELTDMDVVNALKNNYNEDYAHLYVERLMWRAGE